MNSSEKEHLLRRTNINAKSDVGNRTSSPTMRRRKSQCRCCSCKCCLVAAGLVVAILGLTGLIFSLTYPNPLHAQCSIDWKFGISCKDVNKRIVDQMKKWEGPDGCENGGEKCLYKSTSVSDTEIKGTHETPKKHYIDYLTFTFKSTGDSTCSVHGHSTSKTWYAVLDMGTNYCNLHNLINGSSLDKEPGYTETTSDSVCTQYSKRNCDKY